MKTALLCLLLAGCSSIPGVVISDEERKVCEAAGNCTVWTLEELESLARRFLREGYENGKRSI